MLCIKNTKGLCKSELIKLNSLFTPGCTSNLCYDLDTTSNYLNTTSSSSTSNINTSNIFDNYSITDLDINNILYNDYIIYEASDNKISGLIGISTKNTAKLAMINNLFVLNMHSEAGCLLGKKLIGMVKMITKNVLVAIVKNSDSELIRYYHNLGFGSSEIDIDYDTETEIILAIIDK